MEDTQMADISDIWRQQQIIDAHNDQIKAEAWELLRSHGEDWAEAVDLSMASFAESDRDGIRIVGLLAQIGYAHMLATAFVEDAC